MVVVADDPCREAVTKEVSRAIPAFVEGLRIEAVASVHPRREVVELGFDDRVIMRAEHAPRVQLPPEAAGGIVEPGDASVAVVRVAKGEALARAADRDVVDAERRQLVSRHAGHAFEARRRPTMAPGSVRVLTRSRHEGASPGDSPPDTVHVRASAPPRPRRCSTLGACASCLAYRSEFPILETTTYLINHSLGAMPRRVEERLAEYARAWRERGVRAWGEGWWELPITVGDQVGRIIGAPRRHDRDAPERLRR